jgi:hypothetical protein
MKDLLARLENLGAGEWWLRDDVCLEMQALVNNPSLSVEDVLRFKRGLGHLLADDVNFSNSPLGRDLLKFCNEGE